MNNIFVNAKWIWHSEGVCVDDRGEFFGAFEFNKSMENVLLRLSCDSDYAIYINNKFVSSNQYGDFPHYKIYDEIDVAEFLQSGINSIKIVVWYFGQTSQKYYPSSAGLIFELVQGEKQLLRSDNSILSRRSRTYACGRAKNVSSQLGFSFLYDLTAEDETGEPNGILPSVIVDKNCTFYCRPNKKLCYGSTVEPLSVSVKHGGRTVLVDLGREVVGLATLKFYSKKSQRITVTFGEKIIYSA